MRNMLLIARREYVEQIRGRAFRISTVLVPALCLFLLGVSAITGRKMGAGKHIVVACDNTELAADIRSKLLDEKRAGFKVNPKQSTRSGSLSLSPQLRLLGRAAGVSGDGALPGRPNTHARIIAPPKVGS